MEKTAKDYFIKRVETKKTEDCNFKTAILLESIFTASCLAAAISTLCIEELSSSYLLPACEFGLAGICTYDIVKSISNRTKNKKNDSSTEKSKVYTYNLQKEIHF